jgi:hypothetical protein
MPNQDGKEVGLNKYSEGFRNRELVRNKYKATSEYRASHPNALSDGDELGKGENNGSIGSATDIRERNVAEARNRFTKNNQYDISKT